MRYSILLRKSVLCNYVIPYNRLFMRALYLFEYASKTKITLCVRVFCPDASSYLDKAPAEVFALHERLKRNEYAHRICAVDHGSFCPLVFSTQGGCGKEATTFLKSLANQLSEKDGKPYSITMDWIRCRLSFALLRSAVMCIRGSRSAFRRPFHCDRELAVVEGRLQA